MMTILSSWKPLLAASAAAGTALFAAILDCDPQLFLYERFVFDPTRSYQDKTVWIIGASSGIGSTLAVQLAQARCRCLVLSGRNEQNLIDVANQCRQQQPTCQCHCLPVDVTNNNSLHQIVGESRNSNKENSLPPLDMVILNAGVGQLSPVLETDPRVIQRVMQTNAIWPMILLPLLLDHDDKKNDDPTVEELQHDSSPSILVTSSVAAKFPVPLSGPYAAAKAALQHYLLTLNAELPNLRIDVVCPGPVDTSFHSNHVQVDEGGGRRDNTQSDTTLTERQTTSKTAGTTHNPNGQAHNKDKHSYKTDDRQSEETTQASSSSRMKMPVDRCVRLMLAAAALRQNNKRGLSEFWIAQQPVLIGLYLNQAFPTWMRPLYSRIGTKRVQMWRDGLDLYDPNSWTKSKSTTKR